MTNTQLRESLREHRAEMIKRADRIVWLESQVLKLGREIAELEQFRELAIKLYPSLAHDWERIGAVK